MYERKTTEKLKKKFCLIIAVVFMVTGTIVPIYGVSETTPDQQTISETEMPLEYEESADSWRFENGYIKSQDSGISLFSRRAAFIPWSKTDDGFINSNGELIQGAVRKGIDVSSHQGNINWDKVKAAGVDFAIIRCGYGSDYEDQDDSKWLRNITECERVGIPYGVYLYSYANTQAKAKSEAQHTLRLLKEAGADPDYPIYYDLEDKTVAAAGRTNIIKFAEIYCSTLETAGYEAGIYASLSWWNEILNSSSLDDYDKWIAQWYSECTYEGGEYRLWQCTSDGSVDGIDGRVDLNFEFVLKYETINSPRLITDDEGNEIFIDREGNKLTSQWLTYKRKTFYADEQGRKVTGIQQIGGKKYYIDSANGKLISKWVTIGNKKYYFKKDGTMLTGYNTIGGLKYLFDDEGVLITKSGVYGDKVYKVFSSGINAIYKVKLNSAVNYRAKDSTSAKKMGKYKKGTVVSVIMTKSNGWSRLSNGYWVKTKYLNKLITYPRKATTEELIKIVVDNEGNEVFVDLKGNRTITSQWFKYNNKTFYVDEEGRKATGLQEIDGAKYYIDRVKGKLISKWVTIDGKKHYFKKDGTMLTGYNTIGGFKYLFDSKGRMQTGTVVANGKEYKLYSNGIACIYTAKLKKNTVYRAGPSTSKKVKGKLEKGKTVYVIRTSGGWSQLSNGYWTATKNLNTIITYPKAI